MICYFASELNLARELWNIKSRHWDWDLYAKPDASIGLIKKPQNIVFSIIQKDFRTLRACISPKTFLRNLPVKINNFNIFVDKPYLKTDYNVWFTIFWPLQTMLFWDLAHCTGLEFCLKPIKNYILKTFINFCFKIFGIFHSNEN